MPRLLIFVPCFGILHDEDDQSVSLISLIEGLKIQFLPESPEPPAGTIISLRWCAYARWARGPGDEAKHLEQRILLKSPSGVLLMETAPAALPFDDQPNTRLLTVTTKFVRFNVSHPGICPLILEYREAGEDLWTEAASYPLQLEWEKPSPSKSSDTLPSSPVTWHKA
ncbi:MAG TPA: hypothetical protein VII95_09760 [Terriglobales bacterium]|jgi:hypothetical protein